MKTIGLIGGMSWESSVVYYELINQKVKAILGGFHSCKNVMVTVDFAEVEKLQHEGNWDALDKMMATAAKQLQIAGADVVILCTNTMHFCSEALTNAISIPFLHIAEATAHEITKLQLKKIALLGTKFTMEKDFYKDILIQKHGIEVLIPTEDERIAIHNIIYNELVHGQIKVTSRETYKTIIKNLAKRGAEGVILGCTEIPLLIMEKDVAIPIFDTTKIHAESAVEWALNN